MTFHPAHLALLTVVPLLAETPAPTFSQKLMAAEPGIRQLIVAMEYREASAKAEALVADLKPAFDAKDASTTHTSCLQFVYYSRALFLASQAAELAGHWELALEHFKQGKALAQENVDNTARVLTPMIKGFLDQAEASRKWLAANADAIKAAEPKEAPTSAEFDLLERATLERKRQEEGDKWGKVFQDDIARARNDLALYSPQMSEYLEKRLTNQGVEIAEYRQGKGDKVQWAEAVVGSKTYMAIYPEKKDRVAFMHRLLTLAPGSARITRAIDVEMGRAEPEKEAPRPRTRK